MDFYHFEPSKVEMFIGFLRQPPPISGSQRGTMAIGFAFSLPSPDLTFDSSSSVFRKKDLTQLVANLYLFMFFGGVVAYLPLPETNSSPLKMMVSNRNLRFYRTGVSRAN